MGSNNLSDQVMMQITQSGGDSGGPVVFNLLVHYNLGNKGHLIL